jgi:SAM-dependent methyltransferase
MSSVGDYSWYHCIELPDGTQTPGQKIILPIQQPIMTELHRHALLGRRFLDIGCRDGLFSFEAERMGASEILGIDNDLSTGAVEFLIPQLKSSVKMRAANLYDFTVPTAEQFDFVLLAGVLYHLRFPFLGLKRVADLMKPGATLLIETAMWATQQSEALLYCPAPQDSPYEPTSVTFYNDAGLRAALESLGFLNVECRHVMADDGTTHESWDAFLASPYWHVPTPEPEPFWRRVVGVKAPKVEQPVESKIHIARAVYIATRTIPESGHLDKYWYGTHSLNSDHADNMRFLGDFNVAGLLAPPN